MWQKKILLTFLEIGSLQVNSLKSQESLKMAKRKPRKEEEEDEEDEDEVVECNFCDSPIDPEEKFVNLSIAVGDYNKRGDWMQEEVEPDIGAFHMDCFRDLQLFKEASKTKNGDLTDSAKEVMKWIDGIFKKVETLEQKRTLEEEPLEKPKIKSPGSMTDGEARKILGIGKDATDDEIKTAFRAKMKEVHPDLNPKDPKANDKAAKVREAYDALVG